MLKLVSKLLFSNRSPIKRASHDAPIIRIPTHRIPFKIVSRLNLPEPTVKRIASNVSRILSSNPDSHRTNPTHKTIDTTRSSQSVSLFCGKAAWTTATLARIRIIQRAAKISRCSHTARNSVKLQTNKASAPVIIINSGHSRRQPICRSSKKFLRCPEKYLLIRYSDRKNVAAINASTPASSIQPEV